MLHKVWVLLFAVATVLLGGCNEVLFAKLPEPQANEVLAALAQARIEAHKAVVGDAQWSIEVDGAQIGPALLFLRNRGLPSQQGPNMGEVFKKDGMISSPTEERARYAFALQEDIAATLRRIDGVVDARVHVAIPHNDPLASRVVPASASVFLKHRPMLDVGMLTPNIKAMVMASIEGLDYRNIALVAFPVDADTNLEPPAKRTGFMGAQAAPFTAAGEAAAPAASAAGGSADMFKAGLAGISAVGLLFWWLGSGVAQPRWLMRKAAAGYAAQADDGAFEEQAVAALAPSAEPGLFDSLEGTTPGALAEWVLDSEPVPPARD
jgi:type III secretion protein J